LLSFGCQSSGDPVPLDAAMDLQQSGQTDAAIALLVPEDIEKNLQASSLKTLKMSEKKFKSLFRWGRAAASEEARLLTTLVKRTAFLQIEKMQAAEAAGLSVESKQIREQIQRLIRFLKSEDKFLLYQYLGKGIELKLKQVSADDEVSKPESSEAED
jgi:hypothetical protein